MPFMILSGAFMASLISVGSLSPSLSLSCFCSSWFNRSLPASTRAVWNWFVRPWVSNAIRGSVGGPIRRRAVWRFSGFTRMFTLILSGWRIHGTPESFNHIPAALPAVVKVLPCRIQMDRYNDSSRRQSSVWLNSSCCGNNICHSRESAESRLFALDPRFRGDDIGHFFFPQQILNNRTDGNEV
jgi:hypothetical protein